MTFKIGNLYYDIEYERFSLHTHTNNQKETDSSFLPVINIFTDLPRIRLLCHTDEKWQGGVGEFE